MTKRNRLASADGQKVLMRGCAIVVASSCNSLQLQKIACGWWLGPEAGRSLGICSVFEFILTRTEHLLARSAPKGGHSGKFILDLTTTKRECVQYKIKKFSVGLGAAPPRSCVDD